MLDLVSLKTYKAIYEKTSSKFQYPKNHQFFSILFASIIDGMVTKNDQNNSLRIHNMQFMKKTVMPVDRTSKT